MSGSLRARTTLALALTATIAGAVAAGVDARADVLGSSAIGPFRYDVPAGFAIYKTTATGVDMRGPKGAIISIRTGLRGSDALSIARSVVPDDASEETKQVAIQVSGRQGHLVVRKSTTRIFASAACVPGLGRGVAIVLGAPPESYRESCVPWGQVVDGGRVVGDAPAPAAPAVPAVPARRSPPPPPPVEARQPAKHWVELKNISDQSESTCSWDGRSFTLGVGASQRLEATAGLHSFRWQNADGTSGEDRYEVPKFNVFKTCGPRKAAPAAPRPQPAAQPRPQPAPQPAVPQPAAPQPAVPGWSEEDYKEGARWLMNLTCRAIQFVSCMADWPWKQDIYSDEKIASFVAELKTRAELRDFALTIPKIWKPLEDAWNNGTDDDRYTLRRDAAAWLRGTGASSFAIPPDDGGGGDEIDRLLRVKKREWEASVAANRQVALSNYITSSMVSNFIFANTSAAMFTPLVRW